LRCEGSLGPQCEAGMPQGHSGTEPEEVRQSVALGDMGIRQVNSKSRDNEAEKGSCDKAQIKQFLPRLREFMAQAADHYTQSWEVGLGIWGGFPVQEG